MVMKGFALATSSGSNLVCMILPRRPGRGNWDSSRLNWREGVHLSWTRGVREVRAVGRACVWRGAFERALCVMGRHNRGGGCFRVDRAGKARKVDRKRVLENMVEVCSALGGWGKNYLKLSRLIRENKVLTVDDLCTTSEYRTNKSFS